MISTQVPVAGALAPAVAHSHADALDGGALALADALPVAGADALALAGALAPAVAHSHADADDGGALARALAVPDAGADAVPVCVEINQCVGCTILHEVISRR